jgi:hypothetical protein
MPDAAKQTWNCGWLPRLPGNKGAYGRNHNGPDPTDDTCPGYLVGLPLVQEALTAQLWWDKGQLDAYVASEGGRRSPLLRAYVDVVTGAVGELQVERMAEQHQEMERARSQRGK